MTTATDSIPLVTDEAPSARVGSGHWLGVWSAAKPTKPGNYWMRSRTKFDYQRPPRVINITVHRGNRRLIFLFGVKPMYIDEMDADFSGPIPHPKECA